MNEDINKLIVMCEYLLIPYFLRQNPLQARKQMNKIKKALDVLSGDCSNPIIKADMIKVLREQFTGLENSFDVSCNHNDELTDEKERLIKVIDYLDAKIESALIAHERAVPVLLEEAKNRTHFMIRDPVGADDLFRLNVKWLDRTEVADLYHTGESDDVYIIKLLCGGARPKNLVKMINEDKRPYYRRFGKKF